MECANFYATDDADYAMYDINYSIEELLRLRNNYYKNNCSSILSFDGLTKEYDSVEVYRKIKDAVYVQTVEKEYPQEINELCFYKINCYEPNKFVEYCFKLVLPHFEKWFTHDIVGFVKDLELREITDQKLKEFLLFKGNEYRKSIYNGFWLDSVLDFKPEDAISAKFKGEFLSKLDIKFKGNYNSESENLADRMKSFQSTYNYFKKKYPSHNTDENAVAKLLPTNKKLTNLISKPQGRQIV